MRFPFVSLRLAPLFVALLCSACPEPEADKPKEPAKSVAIDGAPTKVPGKHADQSYDEIRYENSNNGLRKLMLDLKTGILADDDDETAVLLASLRLEDDETFLKATFGDKLGAKLSKEYRPHREEIGVLAKHLRRKFDDGLNEIEAYSFGTPGMQTATGYQSEALSKMKTKTRLYSVRFMNSDKKESFHLWSFVHIDGSFRYIGKLSEVADDRPRGGRDLNELRIEDAERVIAREK